MSHDCDCQPHRVATAALWRTFSDEGKISPGWLGWGGARPPPLITFTLTTSKVAVYAPAEWADTLTLLHLYQYMYSVVNPTVAYVRVDDEQSLSLLIDLFPSVEDFHAVSFPFLAPRCCCRRCCF